MQTSGSAVIPVGSELRDLVPARPEAGKGSCCGLEVGERGMELSQR